MSDYPDFPILFGVDWGSLPSYTVMKLNCPYQHGCGSVTLYATWSDVQDPWPCTCGSSHKKPIPGRSGIVTDGS